MHFVISISGGRHSWAWLCDQAVPEYCAHSLLLWLRHLWSHSHLTSFHASCTCICTVRVAPCMASWTIHCPILMSAIFKKEQLQMTQWSLATQFKYAGTSCYFFQIVFSPPKAIQWDFWLIHGHVPRSSMYFNRSLLLPPSIHILYEYSCPHQQFQHTFCHFPIGRAYATARAWNLSY